MECHENSRNPPDPSPPRMRSHTKQNSKASNYAKANAQLRKVSSGGPSDAEELVLLVTRIQSACREGATFIVPVFDPSPVWHTGNNDDLAFTSFDETVENGGLGTEEFVVDDEPLK